MKDFLTQILIISFYLSGKFDVAEIARLFGKSRPTIYRILKNICKEINVRLKQDNNKREE